MSGWDTSILREDTSETFPKSIRQEAKMVAKQLNYGFIYHDRKERNKSVEAFAEVDSRQFAHLSEADAREAAEAYVEALWRKDSVEDSCRVDGEIDSNAVKEADWSGIQEAFQRRADIVRMDDAYAKFSTLAWKNHKAGGDYWTPMMEAQMCELRAALQDPEYPHKTRSGESGFGPEAAQYLLGVELHDMRRVEPMVTVMTEYFCRILQEHQTA